VSTSPVALVALSAGITPVGALASLLLWAGGAFVLLGALGVWRLPEFFTRTHAAGMVDTLGVLLILLGLALLSGDGLVTLRLALILVLILVTAPTAVHALAKAALHGGERPLQPAPGEEGG